MELLSSPQLARLTDLDACRQRGDRTALIDGERSVSYAVMADRVEQRVSELGDVRRVVSLRATNTIDTVITYLACLVAGHVVSIRSRPDDPFAAASPDQLHPDLAALMGTSGSTGAAKSVRLSVGNIESNAVAIAESLHLCSDDVAITSLPLHYCYGLSIVTSHLAVGASVVVTDASVVDACFWDLVGRWGVTTLSGVPHTFELIDRLAADPLAAHPLSAEAGHASIRRVTQAGGRMAPGRVRHHAELGQRHGWDFFVMYGQTEATARMTVLDPDLAAACPNSIGRPVIGGSMELRPVALDALPVDLHVDALNGVVGELVYCGPNVMLGYASEVADLAEGRTVHELITGDIARQHPDGLLEIVGRRSRFVKILGHRIDLDALESRFAALEPAVTVTLAGDDDRIVVAVTGHGGVAVRRELASLPIPRSAVHVHEVDELPHLASGKVDRAAMMGWATPAAARAFDATADAGDGVDGVALESVADLYAAVLGVNPVVPSDTFSSLGGDSLSFVEVSLRLEGLLGALPIGWHLVPVSSLEAHHLDVVATNALRVGLRRTRQVDTSVVIRALGICIIVATHMGVARLAGGAHTLLAVAGYNFARFQLGAIGVPGRIRRGLATVARVAVPASLWIGVQMVLVGGYSVGALFLVNDYFGSPWRRDGRWEYWYFEAFAQIFLVLTLLFAFSPVRRLERRWPFGFAAVVLVAATVVGLQIVEFGDGYNAIFRPHTTVWFVLLGWAGCRSTSRLQRSFVTAVLVGGTAVYFDRWQQTLMVTVLVGLLLWAPSVRLPRVLVPVVGAVAAASMVTFLIHWQVWPLFTGVFIREVAFVLTLATGVAVWAVGREIGRRIEWPVLSQWLRLRDRARRQDDTWPSVART